MLRTKQRDEVNFQLSRLANGCAFLSWRLKECSNRRGQPLSVGMQRDQTPKSPNRVTLKEPGYA